MDSPEGTGHLTTEELFRKHAGFVARFLTRLGVPGDQLEDAVQEVFLVAHRNGGYRPGLAKPTSYLANIAIRAAAQHRRRSGVARQRHSEAPLEQMPGEIEDPARALQVQQDLQRLQLALERLPEDLRTTLVLVELEGESCVSVAAGLGCPVGTIYWRLHQARKELQSALRAADAPRRSARPVPQPGARVQPARSVMLLFGLDGFRRSEASRLLQLAREQPPSSIAFDELLGRHQRLVESGAELPTWATSFAPHASSWLTLLGAGPFAAGAAIVAAVVLTTYWAPLTEPDAPPTKPDAPSQALPTAAETATAHVDPPSEAPAPTVATTPGSATPALEAPSVAPSDPDKVASDRQPKAMQPRAHDAPLSTTRVRADTAAVPAPAPSPVAVAVEERRENDVARPEENRNARDLELAEMRDIERAERLLSDDPQRALELTRSMQQGFPDGNFREERAYVEVMALRALGRSGEMREKAAAFLRGYPTGLYSNRVRKAVAGKAN